MKFHEITFSPTGVAKKMNRVITSLGGVALGTLCVNRKECEMFI